MCWSWMPSVVADSAHVVKSASSTSSQEVMYVQVARTFSWHLNILIHFTGHERRSDIGCLFEIFEYRGATKTFNNFNKLIYRVRPSSSTGSTAWHTFTIFTVKLQSGQWFGSMFRPDVLPGSWCHQSESVWVSLSQFQVVPRLGCAWSPQTQSATWLSSNMFDWFPRLGLFKNITLMYINIFKYIQMPPHGSSLFWNLQDFTSSPLERLQENLNNQAHTHTIARPSKNPT